MSDRLRLYRISEDYLNFLREIEPKIPMNKDNGKSRPFVGIVFSINSMKYIAPLSSKRAKGQTDFKIKIGDEEKSSIRFAYMFPIVEKALIEIDYTKEYKLDEKYTALLINEDLFINQHKERIYEIAAKTYKNAVTKRFNFEKFCCDFVKLEQRMETYP